MSEFRIRCPHYNGRGELLTVSEQFITAAAMEVSEAGDLVFVDEQERVVVAFGRNHWRNVCEQGYEPPLVKPGRGIDELAELEAEIDRYGSSIPDEDMVPEGKGRQ